MSLIMLEPCEDLAWFGSGSIVTGRNGNGVSTSSVTGTIPAAQEADCITVGFAIRFATVTTSNNFVTVKSDTGSTSHSIISMSSAGALSVLRGATTISGPTADGIILPARWHYVEWAIRLHDTLGSSVIRVDGVTVLNMATGDTKNAGAKTVYDAVTFSGINTPVFDDIYLCTATTTPDAFLGDVIIDQLLPNGNGNVNQWVGSDLDSVNNYLLVNESGAPNTSTYVGSSTVGQQDMYALGDVTRVGVPIKAVCHVANMAKSDLTARQVKLVNRRAADNKGVTHVLSTTYANYGYGLTQDSEIYGTAQRITIAGTPNSLGTGEAGPRCQFARAGRITGIRYQRQVGAVLTAAFRVWDSVGTKVVDVSDTQANVAGFFTVTFPTPLTVAAASIYTITIGGTNVGVMTGTGAVVTNTADVTYLNMYGNGSVGSWPTAVDGSTTYFVEPIYEPAGGAWTEANVNALQSGVEVA